MFAAVSMGRRPFNRVASQVGFFVFVLVWVWFFNVLFKEWFSKWSSLKEQQQRNPWGNMLEMHILGPHPRTTESEAPHSLCFYKPSDAH